MVEKRHVNDYPWEAILWMAGLVLVALPDPSITSSWTLCLFDWMGFDFCPGCGLGHAVAYLFRGELMLSLEAHLLGIPAVVVLLGRSICLLKERLLY
jgi:hypothetical protein